MVSGHVQRAAGWGRWCLFSEHVQRASGKGPLGTRRVLRREWWASGYWQSGFSSDNLVQMVFSEHAQRAAGNGTRHVQCGVGKVVLAKHVKKVFSENVQNAGRRGRDGLWACAEGSVGEKGSSGQEQRVAEGALGHVRSTAGEIFRNLWVCAEGGVSKERRGGVKGNPASGYPQEGCM